MHVWVLCWASLTLCCIEILSFACARQVARDAVADHVQQRMHTEQEAKERKKREKNEAPFYTHVGPPCLLDPSIPWFPVQLICHSHPALGHQHSYKRGAYGLEGPAVPSNPDAAVTVPAPGLQCLSDMPVGLWRGESFTPGRLPPFLPPEVARSDLVTEPTPLEQVGKGCWGFGKGGSIAAVGSHR